MANETEIIKRKWRRNRLLWIYGLVSASILGVAHSVTPAIVSPETFNFTTGLNKLITVMIVSGVLGAFTYLAKSPLPALPKELESDVFETEVTVSPAGISVKQTPAKPADAIADAAVAKVPLTNNPEKP